MCTEFLVNLFMGYGVLTTDNSHFPQTTCCPNNSVALPCYNTFR